MLNKKEPDNATRASVKKEMAKPRMAKSVRTAELNLESERVPGQARTTLPGTVHKIIASLRTTQPGKAQITLARADDRYRDLHIEKLTNGDGNEVRPEKGAHVKVTVSPKPKK
jgi:hypothetical protein